VDINDDARSVLDPALVERGLRDREVPWPLPVLVAATGSTNDDVADLAASGAAEGTCVVADTQTAGRGRLGRTWISPAGSGLWLSVLVRPGDVAKERWAWLSLLAGLAAHDAVRSVAGVPAMLKWPNDLVVSAAACGGDSGPRKLGGILSQVIDDDAIAIGIGINVAMRSEDLPVPQATSILLEGGTIDREALLVGILARLHERIVEWRAGSPLIAEDYRTACLTIGRLVEVQLPGGSTVAGIVSGIDEDGHLRVSNGENVSTVTAGDVIHATI
jgi:BirA family biotin operon repressor/biotin-[acetyl-CoA-carboxylase] ligase